MTDVPVRFSGLRGTIAAFAVDLFAGRIGSLTDAPMCSGGYDRWGVYDGSAWRLGPASDYAGNANVLSLLVNGTETIDSARNVKAATLWSGGAIRADANGDFTGRNQTLTGWLTLNGAIRPAWDDSAIKALQLTNDIALACSYSASGGAWSFASNVAYSGGAYRIVESHISLGTSQPRLFQMSTDGSLRYYVDNSAAPVAGAIATLASVWCINRFGGMGCFGVVPPTTRPTISGQRTATATLAALYQALGATGIILDATTGTSVTREAIIQPLPITNAAPGAVTVVSGGIKSFGFDGGASTEELFYHCDIQHDYISGGDMIFHVHWMPSTAGGGNVKWQIEYQWVESGGVWPASATLATTTAAGTTAWADNRSDFTIPGTGHTYNSRLIVRLFRNPADAADTYGADAVLSSVGMHYQADPGQP